ncbi:MAG: hypothetical protein ACYS3S_20120 [Planctomycetota bacterium]
MSKCWCRFAMAVLIIIFAWLDYSWTRIAIIILGILLAIMALIGTCCCASIAEAKTKAAGTAEAPKIEPPEEKE